MTNTSIRHLNEENFEEAIAAATAEKPLLVDFWAEWCGPCKTVAPVLEELAAERADSLQIGKVDVDANAELAKRYKVRGIPTLCLIVEGQVTKTFVGAASKKQLEAFLNND